MVIFDSDCGGEFINHDVAGWLQARDIAQTRSRTRMIRSGQEHGVRGVVALLEMGVPERREV